MLNDHTKNDYVMPSYVGERVKFMGYGGRVKKEYVGLKGTVVDFTARRNPVIVPDKKKDRIADTMGCAKAITDDGEWMVRAERWPEPIYIEKHDKITPQAEEHPVLIRVRNEKGRAQWFQVRRIWCRWYQGEQYLGLDGFKWRPKLGVAEGGPKFIPMQDVITSGSMELNKATSRAARAAATNTRVHDRKRKGKGKKKKGKPNTVTITRKKMVKLRDKKKLPWTAIGREFGISTAVAQRAYYQLTGTEDQKRAAR